MKSIFFSGSYLLVEFLISRYIFEPTTLYYEIWWLDIPMHILGGLGVAWFTISVLRYLKKEVTYHAIICSFLVVAIIWEIYEYVRSLFVLLQPWSGWLDTIKDTINGILGASLFYYFSKKQ